MPRYVINVVTGETQELPALPSQPADRAPVPTSVSMAQARLALWSAGMLPAVEAALAAMPMPQKEAARIEWEYRPYVQRDSMLIAQLAPALGLTEQMLDDLFISASQL